jgi:hypothetical protein
MRPAIEIAPVERLLTTGERLLSILITKDSDIPVDGLEDLQHVRFRVVDDNLVHVFACRYLYLPLHDALYRLVLLGPIHRRVDLDTDDEVIADRLCLL